MERIIQIALAKQFRDGDWRSGYYRDQTWMMAMGLYNPVEFFHQLYGNTNRDINPGSGGRVFNNHFSTPISILMVVSETLQNKRIHQLIFLRLQGRCHGSWDWLMHLNFSDRIKNFIVSVHYPLVAMKLLSFNRGCKYYRRLFLGDYECSRCSSGPDGGHCLWQRVWNFGAKSIPDH